MKIASFARLLKLMMAVSLGLLISTHATAASFVPWSIPQYAYTVQKDIVYGTGTTAGGGSVTDLKLDLYVPTVPPMENGTPNKFALMLMIHGGSFQSGSKTDSNVVASAREYAQRGWLVASIDYRLERDNPVPSSRVQGLIDYFGAAYSTPQVRAMVAAADDTLKAVDFLQARDDVVPTWTTLWGYSAGAVTAVTIGYCLDDNGIARPPVAAVVELAGGAYCAVGTPFDAPIDDNPALMVVHGTADSTVPFTGATQLQVWANEVELPLDFQPIQGGGHSINMFNIVASTGVTLFQRSVDFLHETVFTGLAEGPQPAPGC